MAQAEPARGAGDVEITLGGQKLYLRPTLEVCTRLSRGGGILEWPMKLRRLDIDAFVTVISLGLGEGAKELPALVYNEGLVKLLPPLLQFLDNICHGGRPPDTDEEDKRKDGPLGARK